MLPERLSNFLCSLRPLEDKLCFSAVFEMDAQGTIIKEWFGKSIIHSNHRFTYEDAQLVLDEKKGPFYNELNTLHTIAKTLRRNRTAKGSLFFDRDEVKFHLDENGVPTGVYVKKSLDAHKLIEEFMLLANRRVSAFLESQGKHSVFRGIISGVSEWGVYVELLNSKCEGMIRARDLGNDYFEFEPDRYRHIGKRSRKTYALGDPVEVIVDLTDMQKKQIQFKPYLK